MSKILVDTIDTRSGTSTLTLGSSNLTTLTKASGVTANFAGLKMADLWRQNTDTAISANTETFLTSNWEQADTDGAGTIGSAMSVSSGVFTFPETGVYDITFFATIYSPSQGATFATGRIHTTTDNSSYDRAADGNASIYHANGFSISTSSFMFDVTNTSTHKCKFDYAAESSLTWEGSSTMNRTHVTFIRLGDT